MIDRDILLWMITVPASDGNFKSALEKANLETLVAAINEPSLSKLARKYIENKIRCFARLILNKDKFSPETFQEKMELLTKCQK